MTNSSAKFHRSQKSVVLTVFPTPITFAKLSFKAAAIHLI